MNYFKKFFLLIPTYAIVFTIEAQTVKVTKETARIKYENMEGFEVQLDGTQEEVTSSFTKYLKSFGKVKQSVEGTTISEPTINGSPYTQPLYATTKQGNNTASAWIGLKASEWTESMVDKMSQELEKIIYEFGVKFYRDKIQTQIDEAVRAAQAVEKQQQRLVNENKNLNNKVEDNKREKIQLERSLENNKIELETLLNKIEQNKKAQDSVAVAGEQIKKAVELHKERQRKVN